MTWPRVLATGQGKVSYRLQIEGCRYEFVTDSSMETTTGDGRQRVVGLKRDGLAIREDIDVVNAKIKAGGFTALIEDVAGKPSLAFAKFPTRRTWLNTSVFGTSSTVMAVASSAGWTAGDVIHVGTEAMLISSVGVNLLHVVGGRGHWTTAAQAHYGADGTNTNAPEVVDEIVTYQSRRVRLFAYGDGDSPTSDGTQIFLGRVAKDASLERATTWGLTIDPISSVLDQDIGEDLNEDMSSRGVYYSWAAPCVVILSESNDTSIRGTTGNGPEIVSLCGFYETQEAFVAALNTEIATATTGWSSTYRAVVTDRGWRLEMTTASASPKCPRAEVRDVHHDDTSAGVELLRRLGVPLFDDPVVSETVGASETVVLEVEGPVPRGAFGRPGFLERYSRPELALTYPDGRIYLSGSAVPTATSSAFRVSMPGIEPRRTRLDGDPGPGYSASDRYVDIVRLVRDDGRTYHWTAYGGIWGQVGVRFARNFASGDLYDFIAGITTASPDGANLGSVPDLRATDFDLAEISATVAAQAAGSTYLMSRDYVSTSSKSLKAALAAEAQLLRAAWCFDEEGKLTLRRIAAPTLGDVSTATIDGSKVLTGKGFPGWDRELYGTVNVLRMRTGYDPETDEYTGRDIVVRNVPGFAVNKKVRQVTIEPTFRSSSEDIELAAAAATAAAAASFAIYGNAYAIATVPVGMQCFSVRTLDTVRLTSAQLPNENTGARGLTDRACLVIGKRFNLETGMGQLSLLYSLGRFAGYAPAMRVTAATVVSGNTWDLTLGASPPSAGSIDYLPADAPNADDWFEVGHKIRAWDWNTATPTILSGDVITVAGLLMRVTFTGAGFTGYGVDEWIIGYDVAGTSGFATTQEPYAFMAGTDLRIDFDEPAQILGP